MHYRKLGRTGLQVSPLCLGAMMFGAVGQPRPRRLRSRSSTRALDAGINFIDTADVYSAGESEEIVGKALAGPARRRRARDQVLRRRWARTPTSSGGSRRWIMQECEDSLRRLGTDHIDLYQMHRPDADDRHRRDARRAHRPRAPGQGPLPRQLHLPGVARSSRRSGWPSGATASASCASSRRTRSSCAASSATCCPTCQRYGMGVIPWSPLAGGWLSGSCRKGADDLDQPPGQPHPGPLRPRRCPGNQRKLEAADALGRARRRGRHHRSSHLALAFVLEQPGGHLGDHRAAHDGAARRASSAPPTCTLDRRRARPHRRDRAARAPTSTGPTPATRRRWSPTPGPAAAPLADPPATASAPKSDLSGRVSGP